MMTSLPPYFIPQLLAADTCVQRQYSSTNFCLWMAAASWGQDSTWNALVWANFTLLGCHWPCYWARDWLRKDLADFMVMFGRPGRKVGTLLHGTQEDKEPRLVQLSIQFPEQENICVVIIFSISLSIVLGPKQNILATFFSACSIK